MKYQQHEIDEALEMLREFLQPGDEVYVTVKTVARSGMSRTMAVYMPYMNETPLRVGRVHTVKSRPAIREITHLVAIATGCAKDKRGDIRVGGCGMDMTFWLIDKLDKALFGRDIKRDREGMALVKRNL